METRVLQGECGRRVFCSCEDDGRPSIGNGRPGAVGSTQAGAERAQASEPIAGLFCARAA